MDWEAFFTVHKDLPREGPGSPDDVAWALDLAALPEGAVICDAGAGAGGDVAALARAGRVLAVDQQDGFVAQMQAPGDGAQGGHGADCRVPGGSF